MGSEWRPSTWGDEISLEYGKSLKGYRESFGNVRVYGSNGPVGWTENPPLSNGPGVILGRKGAYRGVQYCEDPFYVIDTAYFVKPKTDLDMRWLYYSIIHHKLGELDDGSPVPSTTRSAVYVTNLKIPPLPEQKAIAHVLGTLDDKIELNRRMNETLEGMAQALFKSWFVDFDPVIDNALAAGNPIPEPLALRAETRRKALETGTANRESAQAFPDSFYFTEELGWIPEGWEVRSIEDERTLRPGLAYKAKHKAEAGTPMITLGSVSFTERFLSKGLVNYTGDFKPQHLVSAGDLVIASHDITQERKQLGSPAMVPRWISAEAIIVATNLFRLSNDLESYLSDHFLYWTLRAEKFREEMIKSARGTAILFINRASAGKYHFARPPQNLSQQFDAVVESLYDAHQNNEVTSRSLTKLRDTLLPKLISGELRIPQAEKMVEESLT